MVAVPSSAFTRAGCVRTRACAPGTRLAACDQTAAPHERVQRWRSNHARPSHRPYSDSITRDRDRGAGRSSPRQSVTRTATCRHRPVIADRAPRPQPDPGEGTDREQAAATTAAAPPATSHAPALRGVRRSLRAGLSAGAAPISRSGGTEFGGRRRRCWALVYCNRDRSEKRRRYGPSRLRPGG